MAAKIAAGVAAHGVPLGTLKECFQFLQWLNGGKGQKSSVVTAFVQRLRHYFPQRPTFKGQLRAQYTKFLTNVSLLYETLVSKEVKRLDDYKVETTQPNHILESLLECTPKILAALYYLQYHVDVTFTNVGGGDWAQIYLNEDPIKTFLTTNNAIMKGGFSAVELKNVQGSALVADLKKILNKDASRKNSGYDHYRNVIMTTLERSWNNFNTGNTVLLVNVFCQLVTKTTDPDGGEFKAALDTYLKGDKICWQALKHHCQLLHGHINKLTDAGFSFTGMCINPSRKEHCAKVAAKWFRANLPEAAEVLKGMVPPSIRSTAELQTFAKDKLYPNGFIFDGSNNTIWPKLNKLDEWDPIFQRFLQLDGLLGQLKTILDGYKCSSAPVATKAEAAKPTATKTEATKTEAAKPIATKTEATKTEGAQNQGKKVEGAQNQGKKVEGAQNQGKKAEGAQNQGKKAEGAQNQGKKAEGNQDQVGGPSETNSPGSPVAKAQQTQTSSHSTAASGNGGGRGLGDQAASSVPVQPSDQRTQTDTGDSTTASTGTISGPGIGGAGDGGGGESSGKTLSPEAERLRKHYEKILEAKKEMFVRKHAERNKAAAELGKRLNEADPQKKREADAELQYQKDLQKRQQLFLQHYRPQSIVKYSNAEVPSNSASQDPYALVGVQGSTLDDGIIFADGEAIQDISFEEAQNAWRKNLLDEQAQNAIMNHFRDEINKKYSEDANILNTSQHELMEAAKKEAQRVTFLEGVQKHAILGGEIQDPPLFGETILDTTDVLGEDEWKVKGQRDLAKMYEEQKQREYDRELSAYLKKVTKGRDDFQPKGIQIEATPISSLISQVSDNFDMDIYVPPHSRAIPEGPDPNITPYVPDQPKPHVDVEVASKWSTNSDDDPNAGFTPGDLFIDLKQNDPYYSLGLPPIHHEIQIERKNYEASNAAENVKVEAHAEQPFNDLSIYVPNRALQDSSYDIHLDDPPPPTEVQPLDPITPTAPAINFNLEPFEVAPTSISQDFDPEIIYRPELKMCLAPWAASTLTASSTDIPETELFPSQAPRTVRDMLTWLAGLKNPKHHDTLEKCINRAFGGLQDDPSQLALSVNGSYIIPQHVLDTIHLTAMFAGSVLNSIEPNWEATVASTTVKPKSSDEPDCCALICQLRDYAYACCHQLQFLKAQCSRDKLSGGWQDCNYGSDITSPNSPLQAFLTDGWESTFKTHLFDPCNLCHKSRIRMGFRDKDLPKELQTGATLSTILTPSCGGSDPLLTLASYLNCLTRRTPRTTGELVSYFHNFGNELHGYASESLSPLGSSLSSPHPNCPDWDHLGDSDLQAVRGIRGHESINSISNHNHDNDHLRTLSTLVGCGDDSSNCHPHCSPITYRAYALYSQSFVHTYLSWTVYLPDRLWEALEKLHYDLQKHLGSDKCSSLYLCPTALPLLYLHGFTPREVGSQPKLTCQQVIAKLKEIVDGKPIASLMTAMDNFLYGIREPFILTIVTLWSLAFLIFANTMLYRIDVLHIRSHLIRTKASHLIDVKALLSDNKKMMSLYDANYFDDDPNELLNLR